MRTLQSSSDKLRSILLNSKGGFADMRVRIGVGKKIIAVERESMGVKADRVTRECGAILGIAPAPRERFGIRFES